MSTRAQGFTLIEVLLYSAIVSIFLVAALGATYQLIQAQGRAEERSRLAQDKQFALQKIEWLLRNVEAINTPTSGNSGASLSVDMAGYAYNPFVLSENGGVLELVSGATTTQLTHFVNTITSLNFEHQNLGGTSAIHVTAKIENDVASTTIDTLFLIQ